MKPTQFYNSTAWKYFSRYILLKYAKVSDKDVIVRCWTSGRYYLVNDRRMHCGHFVKVFDSNNTHMATAFDEVNVFPQSSKDNVYSGGKQDVAMVAIENVHGDGTVMDIMRRSKNICKLGKFELDLIAKEYKQKYDQRIKEIGFDPWKK